MTTKKKDHQARFMELFSRTNFLGSGLSLEQFTELYTAEKLAASWALQDKKERARRLSLVTDLCAELTQIKVHHNFATRIAELAIESVIEGDWPAVKDWAEQLSFANENEQIRQRSALVYARFSELLMQAYATRPEAIEVRA